MKTQFLGKKTKSFLIVALIVLILVVAVACGVETYTVTFNVDGGAPAPAVQEVEEGKTATKPTAPTKSGYTFGGWYESSSFSGSQYDFSTPVTKNITLYAKWTQDAPVDPNKEAADKFKSDHATALALTVTNVTISNETIVNAAVTAYGTLSDGAKALLTAEKTKLDELVAKIADLKAEQAAAETDVNAFRTAHADALALTVNSVAVANEEIVNAAVTAYAGLSSAAKTLAAADKTLLDSLVAKIEELKNAVNVNEAVAKFRADHVVALALTTSSVTAAHEAIVKAAIDDYNAQGSAVKSALASEIALLNSLMAKLPVLVEIANFQTTHARVLGLTVISVSYTDRAAVQAALTAFNALSATAKTTLSTQGILLQALSVAVNDSAYEDFNNIYDEVLKSAFTVDDITDTDDATEYAPIIAAALEDYATLPAEVQTRLIVQYTKLTELARKAEIVVAYAEYTSDTAYTDVFGKNVTTGTTSAAGIADTSFDTLSETAALRKKVNAALTALLALDEDVQEYADDDKKGETYLTKLLDLITLRDHEIFLPASASGTVWELTAEGVKTAAAGNYTAPNIAKVVDAIEDFGKLTAETKELIDEKAAKASSGADHLKMTCEKIEEFLNKLLDAAVAGQVEQYEKDTNVKSLVKFTNETIVEGTNSANRTSINTVIGYFTNLLDETIEALEEAGIGETFMKGLLLTLDTVHIEKFETAHAAALALTPATVDADDLDIIEAAVVAFQRLPATAQKSFAEKINTLQAARTQIISIIQAEDFREAHAGALALTVDGNGGLEASSANLLAIVTALHDYQTLTEAAQDILVADYTKLIQLEAHIAVVEFKNDADIKPLLEKDLTDITWELLTDGSVNVHIKDAIDAFELLSPAAKGQLAAEKALLDSFNKLYDEVVAYVTEFESFLDDYTNTFDIAAYQVFSNAELAAVENRAKQAITAFEVFSANGRLVLNDAVDDVGNLTVTGSATVKTIAQGIVDRVAAAKFLVAHNEALNYDTSDDIKAKDISKLIAINSAYDALSSAVRTATGDGTLAARITAYKQIVSFANIHSAAIALTADTAELSNKTIVANAITAYNSLASGTQDYINGTIKTILDSISGNITAAENFKTSKASLLNLSVDNVAENQKGDLNTALSDLNGLANDNIKRMLATEKAHLIDLSKKVAALVAESFREKEIVAATTGTNATPAITIADIVAYPVADVAKVTTVTNPTIDLAKYQERIDGALAQYNGADFFITDPSTVNEFNKELKKLLAEDYAKLMTLDYVADSATEIQGGKINNIFAYAYKLPTTTSSTYAEYVALQNQIKDLLTAVDQKVKSKDDVVTSELIGDVIVELKKAAAKVDAEVFMLTDSFKAVLIATASVTGAMVDQADLAITAFKLLSEAAQAELAGRTLAITLELLEANSIKARVLVFSAADGNYDKIKGLATTTAMTKTQYDTNKGYINSAYAAFQLLDKKVQESTDMAPIATILNNVVAWMAVYEKDAFTNNNATGTSEKTGGAKEALALTTGTVTASSDSIIIAAITLYNTFNKHTQKVLENEKALLDTLLAQIYLDSATAKAALALSMSTVETTDSTKVSSAKTALDSIGGVVGTVGDGARKYLESIGKGETFLANLGHKIAALTVLNGDASYTTGTVEISAVLKYTAAQISDGVTSALTDAQDREAIRSAYTTLTGVSDAKVKALLAVEIQTITALKFEADVLDAIDTFTTTYTAVWDKYFDQVDASAYAGIDAAIKAYVDLSKAPSGTLSPQQKYDLSVAVEAQARLVEGYEALLEVKAIWDAAAEYITSITNVLALVAEGAKSTPDFKSECDINTDIRLTLAIQDTLAVIESFQALDAEVAEIVTKLAEHNGGVNGITLSLSTLYITYGALLGYDLGISTP